VSYISSSPRKRGPEGRSATPRRTCLSAARATRRKDRCDVPRRTSLRFGFRQHACVAPCTASDRCWRTHLLRWEALAHLVPSHLKCRIALAHATRQSSSVPCTHQERKRRHRAFAFATETAASNVASNVCRGGAPFESKGGGATARGNLDVQ